MGVQGLSYVVTDEQRPLGKWKSKCKGPEVRSITQWTGICPEKCSKNISMRGLWNPTHLEPGWFQQTSMPDTNWSSLPSFLQSRKRAGLPHSHTPLQDDMPLLHVPFQAEPGKSGLPSGKGDKQAELRSSNTCTWQSGPDAAFVITPLPGAKT